MAKRRKRRNSVDSWVTTPIKIVGNEVQTIASTPFQKKAFSKFVSKLKRLTSGK